MLFIRSFLTSSLRPSYCFQNTLRAKLQLQLLHRASFSISPTLTMAQEYKLKNLSSIELKNGQMQEAEVEGIEEGKVLLAKVKDEVHALGSKCTHYGAPLAKGVLTGDGRLTCPWHGACFNVKSGDIEESPALDSLLKFEVVQKDGGVYVKAQEKDIKSGGRRTASMGRLGLVLVGVEAVVERAEKGCRVTESG